MEILSPFQIALSLLLSFEPELMRIIGLSLGVSLTAVMLSLVIGLPFGALLAAYSFPGRGAIIVVTNTLLGMPPVVVGLAICWYRAPVRLAFWVFCTRRRR
jgi:tungstate transport system permease protein